MSMSAKETRMKEIRKNYAKISPPVRYSMIRAAIARGDEEDRLMLVDTTPRNTFKILNTYGVISAWEFLSHWYVMSQLGDATRFFLAARSLGRMDKKTERQLEDAMTAANRRFLTRAQAWRELCEENKLDPAETIAKCPDAGLIDMVETLFAVMKAMKDGQAQPNRKEVDALRNGWQEIIMQIRQEWE